MSFTNIEVTGTFQNASGKALNGRVVATLCTAIQNADHTVEPSPIQVKIVNGKLTMQLVANNDSQTVPQHSFYLFQIYAGNTPPREFKAVVPFNAIEGKIDVSELYEKSGLSGIQQLLRPVVRGGANVRELINALGALGIIEVIPQSEGEHNELEV